MCIVISNQDYGFSWIWVMNHLPILSSFSEQNRYHPCTMDLSRESNQYYTGVNGWRVRVVLKFLQHALERPNTAPHSPSKTHLQENLGSLGRRLSDSHHSHPPRSSTSNTSTRAQESRPEFERIGAWHKRVSVRLLAIPTFSPNPIHPVLRGSGPTSRLWVGQ